MLCYHDVDNGGKVVRRGRKGERERSGRERGKKREETEGNVK